MRHRAALSALAPPRSRTGLSLAEVSICTLLVGVLLVAALRSAGSSLRTWQAAADTGDGSALAQQLLDEILAQTYAEDTAPGAHFGIETGETSSPATRALFDDLDDYNGWTATPPQDAAGNALSGHAGWSRSVVVQKLHATSFSVLPDSDPDTGLRQITVTVTAPDGRTTTLSGWRSSGGGTQQPLAVDQTIVTWVGCELRLTSGDTAVTGGTLVANHAEDL